MMWPMGEAIYDSNYFSSCAGLAVCLIRAHARCFPTIVDGPRDCAPEKIMDGAVGLPMDCNVALGCRPTVSLLPGSSATRPSRPCLHGRRSNLTGLHDCRSYLLMKTEGKLHV